MAETPKGEALLDDADEHLAILGFLQQVLRQPPGNALGAGAAEGSFDEAEADRDFRRLFEGPEKPVCPPWESAFNSEDDLLFQRETLEVRAFYRRYNLALDTVGREPEDHIAFELAFCSYLIAAAKQAHEAGDAAESARALADLGNFYHGHLGSWGPAWSDRLAAQAASPFYREVAAALKEELETLGALLPELEA